MGSVWVKEMETVKEITKRGVRGRLFRFLLVWFYADKKSTGVCVVEQC